MPQLDTTKPTTEGEIIKIWNMSGYILDSAREGFYLTHKPTCYSVMAPPRLFVNPKGFATFEIFDTIYTVLVH